jgi:hypothetical protein
LFTVTFIEDIGVDGVVMEVVGAVEDVDVDEVEEVGVVELVDAGLTVIVALFEVPI